MKNLLMIIPFFPPMAGGGVYRPLAFVKYLEGYGWRPIVVAPRAESFWIRDDSLMADVPPECEVHRTDTMSGQFLLSKLRRSDGDHPPQTRSSKRFSTLRKFSSLFLVPDSYVGWYPFAVREGKKILKENEIDAIYSTSPPETSHLIAKKLHSISRVPWVADFRDPWMNLYLSPNGGWFYRQLHRSLERSVVSRAISVVTSARHKELLKNSHSKLKRIDVISNGYDLQKMEPTAGTEPPDNCFTIMHAGMLTQQRSAIPFLKGLREFLKKNPRARDRCRVTFAGARETKNQDAVSILGLQDVVEFKDTVPHRESLEMQRASHVLLLIKHTNPVYDGIVPGKLYEYIGLCRPILGLVPNGEARETIRTLRRGEVVGQEDPMEIARTIQLMYEKFEARKLDSDYDLTPLPQFDRRQLTARLAKLLDSSQET